MPLSALLKIFGGNYQLYFVILLLGALGTSCTGYFYQRGEAIEYKDKVNVLNKDLVDAKDALTTNALAVTSLTGALAEWKAKADAAIASQGEALKKLDEQTTQMAQQKLKLATTEKTDNALPNCTKLLALDLGTLCPGHVAAMRVRATNPIGVQGPHRQGAGPNAHSP
jgi:hypothetical protein